MNKMELITMNCAQNKKVIIYLNELRNNERLEGACVFKRLFNIGDKDFKAKFIGADPLSDIAVLQIETTEKFIPVKFGDSDKARIGDEVIAIGNPFGLGGTVTSGIISARNRNLGGTLARYEDYIQTDASINTGNSGGPLFDLNGDCLLYTSPSPRDH